MRARSPWWRSLTTGKPRPRMYLSPARILSSVSCGDRRAVGDAAGEARIGRLVPRGEAELLRQGPDVLLGEAGQDERADDAPLLGGPAAGPVIGEVVDVGRVVDDVDPEGPGQLGDPVEELALAVVAAVGRIGREGRAGELVGLDEDLPDAELAGRRAGPSASPRACRSARRRSRRRRSPVPGRRGRPSGAGWSPPRRRRPRGPSAGSRGWP